MTRGHFWTYIDDYAAMGGKGFGCFSAAHFAWLAVLSVLIALFVRLYRAGSPARRDNMRKGAALFLIFTEIAKQCVAALTGAPSAPMLPLHICSFAEYAILIDACWPENRFCKPLLCFAFLPSGIAALLVPTVTRYPAVNFYTLTHFALHAGITAYVAARYAAGEAPVRYRGVWTSLLTICVLTVPIHLINQAFDRNFMFLARHSDIPPLKVVWELTGGTGGAPYIAGLIVLACLVLHVFYGLFALAEALKKRRAAGRASKEPSP